MNNKKAIVASKLVKIILVLVVGLILFAFITNFVNLLQKQSPKELCRLSVLAAAKSKLIGKPLIDSINCKTRYVNIDHNSIDLNKKKVTSINVNNQAATIEIVKRTVADELVTAWYQFGEGKLNPYGDFESGNKCIISSVIRFDESFSSKIPRINSIGTYLEKTNIAGTNLTYLEYLVNGKIEKELNFVEKAFTAQNPENADDIITSQPYYVLFVIGSWDGKLKALIDIGGLGFAGFKLGSIAGPYGMIAGTIGGMAAGVYMYSETKDDAAYLITVVLIPADELPDTCDSLEA